MLGRSMPLRGRRRNTLFCVKNMWHHWILSSMSMGRTEDWPQLYQNNVLDMGYLQGRMVEWCARRVKP